jgi:hypothetical protein
VEIAIDRGTSIVLRTPEQAAIDRAANDPIEQRSRSLTRVRFAAINSSTVPSWNAESARR